MRRNRIRRNIGYMYRIPNRRASVAVWGGVASLDRRGVRADATVLPGRRNRSAAFFTASRRPITHVVFVNTFRKEQFTQGTRALLSLPRRPLGATPAVSDQTRFLPTAPEPPGLPCPPPFLTHPKPRRVLHVIPTARTTRPPPIVLSLLRAWTRQPLQNHRLCSRRTGDPQPHSSPPRPW